MYRVVISPSANADLFNALKYIAYELENQQAAEALADGIGKSYADLEELPAAHELCRDPVLRRMGYRRYQVGNYLVILTQLHRRGGIWYNSSVSSGKGCTA